MAGPESNDQGAKPNETNKREMNIYPLHVATEGLARSNKSQNHAPNYKVSTQTIRTLRHHGSDLSCHVPIAPP